MSVSRIKREEKTEAYILASKPLRVKNVAGAAPRVSLYTDSVNPGSLFGGVGTAVILAAQLAQARGARLRLVTRTEPAKPNSLDSLLSTYKIALDLPIEFAFSPFYDRSHELEVGDADLHITTSWWTTKAVMASVPGDSVLYLLQEDERMFYPLGAEQLACAGVLQSRDIHFAVNTRLLFDHFRATGLHNVVEKGHWFEPSFPADVYYPRPPRSAKRSLMFYARPNNVRNLFYFGVELLDAALARGILDPAQVDLIFVGRDIPNLSFNNGMLRPERLENLSWAQYAELVGSVDLGLTLMYTPHPSYPPLDLAASGAIAVTNRFGSKQSLGAYSDNIVCGELNLEAMLQALAEGLELSAQPETRKRNLERSGLGRDWTQSFAPLVARFGSMARA